jgi:hypothetical protein
MNAFKLVLASLVLCAGGTVGAIEMFQAESVKPWQPPSQTARQQVAATPQQAASVEGVKAMLGAWQSSVAGAVWTTPSSIPGWSNLNVSPGALAGLLVIYPDGTYVWNSYGGKKGRWTPSTVGGYPVALEDRAEKKTWLVGPDTASPGRIFIWDGGSFYYTAKRPPSAR